MPRIRIYGTQNWRDNLSQPRYTPDQIQAQQLRNQIAQERLDQFPLQNEARQAQLARAQGAEAKARYELQKEIETDRQKAAFYNGLQELESNLNAQGYGIGTKQHAEAFAAYAHAFPLARSSADVDKTLQLHAKVNDDQAALTHRIQTQLGAFRDTGLTPEGGSVTQSGDVDVRFKAPQQDAESKLGKLYGFTPQQFLNPYKVEAGNFNDKGQFVNDANGSAFRVTAGANKEGTGALVKIMPKAEFESFKSALMPAQGKTTQTATSTPAVPTIGSKEDYDALEAGAQFTSGGKLFVKPAQQPAAAEEDTTDTE